MSYPPPPRPAEEYELTSPEAATSALPGSGGGRPSMSINRPRKVTIHPNSAGLLFAAPGARPPARRHARHPSNPMPFGGDADAQVGHNFLSDERTEQVDVPDLGQLLGFNEGDDAYTIAANMRSPWKRKLYLLMEEPNSGREALFIHLVVTGAILFSTILTTLSTLPAFITDQGTVKAMFGLDTALVVLFSMEYIARSLAHSDSWSQYRRWVTSFFAIVDLIAILPYYIEVIRQEDTMILFRFSILRTFRLLRVFRAFKYQNQMLLTIEVMYVAVRRSKDALIAISYFIVLVLVLFSTLIYFAERGTWDPALQAFVTSDGEVSLFDSIPQTAWYALVTMSTAGYGDVVPHTAFGKVLSVPLLLFGLLLIALPSFVLGRNFAIVYDAMVSVVGQPGKETPRDSFDHSADQPATPASETAAGSSSATAPLLPTSNGRSGSPANGHELSMPKMWAGDPNRHTPDMRPAVIQPQRERDLTNVKLAKNQAVLLEQIESLRRTIDKQGEMLVLLTQAVAGQARDKGKARASDDEWS